MDILKINVSLSQNMLNYFNMVEDIGKSLDIFLFVIRF